MDLDELIYHLTLEKANPEEKKRLTQKRHWDKIADSALKRVLGRATGSGPEICHHTFFGATDIDPKHLSIWYFFKTEASLKQAQDAGFTDLMRTWTLAELEAGGYSKEALPEVYTSFASDEDVQRNYGGNYFEYLR